MKEDALEYNVRSLAARSSNCREPLALAWACPLAGGKGYNDRVFGLAFALLEGASLAAASGTEGLARRSEEHTSELQSHLNLVCRLLLEKKKIKNSTTRPCDMLL